MASILPQLRPMGSLLPFLCPQLGCSSSSTIRRQFTTSASLYFQKPKQQLKILGRYSTLPQTFYRCERFPGIKVRDKRQMDKGWKGNRAKTGIYWDVITTKGDLIQPIDPTTNIMEDSRTAGPNGITIRTNTESFLKQVLEWNKGTSERSMGNGSGVGTGVVYELRKGLVLPKGLVLIEEKEDFWSLQPSEVMKLGEFQKSLDGLFKELRFYRREAWLEKFAPEWAEYEDPDGKL